MNGHVPTAQTPMNGGYSMFPTSHPFVHTPNTWMVPPPTLTPTPIMNGDVTLPPASPHHPQNLWTVKMQKMPPSLPNTQLSQPPPQHAAQNPWKFLPQTQQLPFYHQPPFMQTPYIPAEHHMTTLPPQQNVGGPLVTPTVFAPLPTPYISPPPPQYVNANKQPPST